MYISIHVYSKLVKLVSYIYYTFVVYFDDASSFTCFKALMCIFRMGGNFKHPLNFAFIGGVGIHTNKSNSDFFSIYQNQIVFIISRFISN